MNNLDRQLAPFFSAALIYALGGIVYFWVFGDGAAAAAAFLSTWILGTADLFALAKTIIAIINILSQSNRAFGPIIFWGSLKILLLGAIGAIFFVFREMPRVPMVFGMTTVVFTTLLGGVFWTLRFSKDA